MNGNRVDRYRRFAMALHARYIETGGATMDWSQQSPKSGYAVGEFGTEVQIRARPTSHATVEDIEAYISRADVQAALAEGYIGVWRDCETGVTHLDVVRVFHSQDEAAAHAALNHQLAYHDVANAADIRRAAV